MLRTRQGIKGVTVEPWRNGLAGLSIAGLLLPEAVAYAAIAGLPPDRAIIAAIVGCLAYALAGQSRSAIVAPTSSSAAMLAATLAAIPGDAAARDAFATSVVLMTGGLFVLASLFRLGGLTGFISRPVLRGFSFGLAVTIILHQLPDLLGIHASGTNLASFLADLFRQLPQGRPSVVALGCLALALLLFLRRWTWFPGPLLVMLAGLLLGHFMELEKLDILTVGRIDFAPALPGLDLLPPAIYAELGRYSLPLVLILFAESWGTVRSLGLRDGGDLRADRELLAFGLANLASGLLRGMPVGAGFSAGSAAQAAGASNRLAGAFAALSVGLMVLFAGHAIETMPRAIPAAVVIAALVHALDPKPFLRLWKIGRDNYLAMGTAAGILVFGVLNGMLLAVVLSLVAMLRRLSHPHVARLARLPESRDYVDAARHPDAQLPVGLVILRPAAPLFYANADTVLSAVARMALEEPLARNVVLSLEESFDLDTTALDQLVDFDRRLSGSGRVVAYARVHDHVRDLMQRAGEDGLLMRCHYSVDDAVRALTGTGN